MKCNGCGNEFDRLAGVLGYGSVVIGNGWTTRDPIRADHTKTLCPRCQHVLKDILLSSDLSDHWQKYEWSAVGEEYTEIYDGTQESD